MKMKGDYRICKMKESNIVDSVAIWVRQYGQYCGGSDRFSHYWLNNTGEITGYLTRKVMDGTAMIARPATESLGYLTYDEFPFNGEKSAFCPAIAHAANDEHKEQVYLCLYQHIAGEWVDRGVFNHMWTIFYDDTRLRTILYDLGFGSYSVDAYASEDDTLIIETGYEVREAGLQDVGVLCSLVEESTDCFSGREWV